MHFCPDKKCMDPFLKLDNDPIQFVKEAKFLGLIWDTKFTFEPHIKYLKARCQKSLNVLKIPEHPESPLSYRMGCRSNYIIEIVSLPGYNQIEIGLWLFSLWINFKNSIG